MVGLRMYTLNLFSKDYNRGDGTQTIHTHCISVNVRCIINDETKDYTGAR